MSTLTDLLDLNRPDTLSDVRKLLDRARRDRIPYFPSPIDWRDQVLYFLLPDLFSDGKEASRPLLTRDAIQQLRNTASRAGWNWHNWAESGKRWQGGTINGIRGQLDYLQNLGITTIWVGPIFKQRVRVDSYHGYGIQDFLDVDPRFGSRRDLIDLVSAAHAKGIRIILDIIMNHSGDNWGYVPPKQPLTNIVEDLGKIPYLGWPNFYGNPNDPTKSGWQMVWRNESQVGFTSDPTQIQDPHAGIWPRELQNPQLYTRAGKGDLGIGEIGDPHAENKRTDFFSLKDFALDAPNAISFLADCYKYWIALTDCDGFRIDTVKHVSLENARDFCGSIREFADSLGKRNFFLVGEIAGGDVFQDFFLDRLAILQSNLNAALDIGEARTALQATAKGLAPANTYLNLFKVNTEDFGSHRTVGNRHVSILDDHDHVSGEKIRFSAGIPDSSAVKDYQVVVATAFQLFTLGIPCIYYGTEQAFAGPAQSQLPFVRNEGWNDAGNYGDRYLREAMFGPEYPRAYHTHDLATQMSSQDTSLPGFGPFGTAGKHCFDVQSPAYVRLAALCQTRSEHLVLRTGRQYSRQIRLPGTGFEFPPAGELVAWSRILDNQEAVCLVNPHAEAMRGGDVLVAAELCPPGTEFLVVANTAQAATQALGQVAGGATFNGSHPTGSKLPVQHLSPTGPAFIEIRNLPPAEVLVLVKIS